MNKYDTIHQQKSGLNDADWEKLKSILYPRCSCGAFFNYITGGYYEDLNQNYEVYACNECGKWRLITKPKIILEENDG